MTNARYSSFSLHWIKILKARSLTVVQQWRSGERNDGDSSERTVIADLSMSRDAQFHRLAGNSLQNHGKIKYGVHWSVCIACRNYSRADARTAGDCPPGNSG